MEAFKYLKIGKAPGQAEVCAKIIVASGDVEIRALMDLCLRILDGKGMPEEWSTTVEIPISKGKGDIMYCGKNRGEKLLEYAIKIVKRYLRKDF